MNWVPGKKEQEFLKLIIAMTSDCIMGVGINKKTTYISNLEMIINRLEEIPDDTTI